VLVIVDHRTRRLVHIGMTRNPTLGWVKQQIRDACPWAGPKFIIHDNDGIFGQYGRRQRFRCAQDAWLWQGMDIRGIPTPVRAPNWFSFSWLAKCVLDWRGEGADVGANAADEDFADHDGSELLYCLAAALIRKQQRCSRLKHRGERLSSGERDRLQQTRRGAATVRHCLAALTPGSSP
jgi:hypothetical protein